MSNTKHTPTITLLESLDFALHRLLIPESQLREIVVRISAHDELVVALQAMKRCPGFYQTDQETGEVFGNLVNAALAKVQS